MKKLLIVLVSCLVMTGISAPKKKTPIIFLDAGHGGFDGGATSGEVYEKDIALAITLSLESLLTNAGFQVLLTRSTDKALDTDINHRKRTDIQKRCQMINESDASMFVSIHLNAFPIANLKGAQVFYYGEGNKELAEIMQNSFRNVLGNTTRIAKPISNIYLLEHVNKLGVLAEVGFLSNQEEKELLLTKAYQEKIAFTLYLAILEYESKKSIS